MSRLSELFVTLLYREELGSAAQGGLIASLKSAAADIARSDRAGQTWSRDNDYPGYTSYASLNDLPDRNPVFADLVKVLDGHVARFAKSADLDLGRGRLALDSMWINSLDPGGSHASHIHPHSVVSGTLYLTVPRGSSAIKFEDPRLPMLMAAPPRKAAARDGNRTFVSVDPVPGTLLLWESWLRHEVPYNHAKAARVSISFNHSWVSHSPST